MHPDADENLARLAERDSARLEEGVVRILAGQIVDAARGAFDVHLRTIILKGSAVMGGFIPYFSDFDVQLFVDSSALCNATIPTPERTLVFQERIGSIDSEALGLGYIQVTTVSWDNDADVLTPLVPGTYRVISGDLPRRYESIASQPEQLFGAASDFLNGLDHIIDKHLSSVFDRADSGLAREVRYLATSLKPAVRQAAVVLGMSETNPVTIWQLSFSEVVHTVERIAIANCGISSFYGDVIGGTPTADGWLSLRRDPSRLRELFLRGIESLVALRAWYAHR